ncbi:MAG: AraC family transcriptional regulator [Steroidobacteraceae bacterium]
MPDSEHVIAYHVVTSGECWAAVNAEAPRRLRRGDIILLPQGDAHVVSSAPGLRAEPNVGAYFAMGRDQRPFRVHYAGGLQPEAEVDQGGAPLRDGRAPDTTLVCGFIGCDARPFNPLLATLPRLMHLAAGAGNDCSSQFATFAAAESASRRPGGEALLERLSEMMFVDAIRRHVDTLPEESTGWLAGLRDRIVGRALTLLHERPAAAWTIDELGSQVGLSRSALHQRFVDLVGQPPMQYLTQWRMQLASRLLRDTQQGVAAIALDVGYDSEAAFTRAFRRAVGMPPAAWRRQQARSATAAPVAAQQR